MMCALAAVAVSLAVGLLSLVMGLLIGTFARDEEHTAEVRAARRDAR